MGSEIATDLHLRLKEVRTARGMSARALSLKAGLSQAHVGQIESQKLKGGVGYTTILRIARAANVSIAYLLENKGSSDDPFLEPTAGAVLGRHSRWAELVAEARKMRPKIPEEIFRDLGEAPFVWGPIESVDAVLVADLAQSMYEWEGREPKPEDGSV